MIGRIRGNRESESYRLRLIQSPATKHHARVVTTAMVRPKTSSILSRKGTEPRFIAFNSTSASHQAGIPASGPTMALPTASISTQPALEDRIG